MTAKFGTTVGESVFVVCTNIGLDSFRVFAGCVCAWTYAHIECVSHTQVKGSKGGGKGFGSSVGREDKVVEV